mmetsp:Transcript_3268/g.4744  ORF Transcript_3268/g.4744 Transcript_3268/m.4744 type:complete len:236 (+) Transcript_3268:454-1161(+)
MRSERYGERYAPGGQGPDPDPESAGRAPRLRHGSPVGRDAPQRRQGPGGGRGLFLGVSGHRQRRGRVDSGRSSAPPEQLFFRGQRPSADGRAVRHGRHNARLPAQRLPGAAAGQTSAKRKNAFPRRAGAAPGPDGAGPAAREAGGQPLPPGRPGVPDLFVPRPGLGPGHRAAPQPPDPVLAAPGPPDPRRRRFPAGGSFGAGPVANGALQLRRDARVGEREARRSGPRPRDAGAA